MPLGLLLTASIISFGPVALLIFSRTSLTQRKEPSALSRMEFTRSFLSSSFRNLKFRVRASTYARILDSVSNLER